MFDRVAYNNISIVRCFKNVLVFLKYAYRSNLITTACLVQCIIFKTLLFIHVIYFNSTY